MNRKIRNGIWTVAIAIASVAMSLTACSSDDCSDEVRLQGKNEVNNMPEDNRQQVEARLCAYAVMPTGTRKATGRRDSGNGANGALFTDDDIEWFDVNTRELRFRDTPTSLNGRLQLLGGIDFYLDGEFLFEGGATYVGLICSQVFPDLVLCQGRIEDGQVIDDCYYLQDCYPLQFIDTDEVKANIKKRVGQWEKFTKYLESRGKLMK